VPVSDEGECNRVSLVYISDRDSGWWNLHRATLTLLSSSTDPFSASPCLSLDDPATVSLSHAPVLLSPGYEFGKPQWNFGTSSFDFLISEEPHSHRLSCRLVCMWHDVNHTMLAVLCSPFQTHTLPATAEYDPALVASLRTDITLLPLPSLPSPGAGQPIQLTSCSRLKVALDLTLIMLGGSPLTPLGLYAWDISAATLSLIQSSVPLASLAAIPSSFLSVPRHLSFPTFSEDHSPAAVAHGWYYAPTHPVHAPSGVPSISSPPSLPPLLVKCHGGPTGATSTDHRLDIQFFTSRGVAVLDVDYSGSSGYGRAYRQRLYKRWGVYDRKDCVSGVKELVARGLVDERRVAIDGSSAGGYTTLASITLEEESVFSAATSSYGPPSLPLSLTSPRNRRPHSAALRYSQIRESLPHSAHRFC
jgi:hypothetical protein